MKTAQPDQIQTAKPLESPLGQELGPTTAGGAKSRPGRPAAAGATPTRPDPTYLEPDHKKGRPEGRPSLAPPDPGGRSRQGQVSAIQ